LVRQRQLKVLAAEADARWNAKESYLDAPNVQQSAPMLGRTNEGVHGLPEMVEGQSGERMQENWTGTAESTGVNGNAPQTTGQQSRAREMADTTVGKIGIFERDPERTKVDGGRRPKVYTNPGLAKQSKQEKKEPPIPKKDDPWQKVKRGGPSEEWQPQAWNPSAATPRS
jgi:NADH dehydrogenase [ubiquinone] 1 alpha subcomplex assembly factor 2